MPGAVLVTVPIPEPGLEILRDAVEVTLLDRRPDREQLTELLASGAYDVVVAQLTDRLDAEVLAEARIHGIANYAVGVDNVDIGAATEHQILVTNTPGVLTDSTADIAMLLMLATARRAVEGDRLVRDGGFTGWSPGDFLGTDVSGTTLGLVGRGPIATAVARRAHGFGMTVHYCSVRPGAEPRAGDLDGLGTWVDFPELIATCDIVSLHVPLTVASHHLVDAGALGRMQSHTILVNTARGPVVDEAALAGALREGTIAGAGLDVYEHEPEVHPGLLERDDVVLLPHVGSATHTVRSRMAEMCARNAVAIAHGERPPQLVNPEAWRA